ncbi:peptidyl-prolyl cis-trans isomerase PpiD [alpha proteobacterium U9-1i]|nr:peptidyl-prolyl cis-trans isomerase PpiD [alpha proteobacterium U9-1i]
MLAQLRNLTRGWIAYLLLFLLAVAFAMFGVNDVFNGVGSQNLAEVGGRAVTPQQLSREMEIYLRQMRNQGNNISQADAIEAGLHSRLLESLIARTAMENYADKIGVSASDAQVADRIREFPPVLNPLSGQFDTAAYDGFLRELGYSRPEFEREIRNELTTGMFMEALVAGARAPSSFGKLVLAYESERRTVSLAEAPASLAGQIPAPNEAQVQAFYEENEASLRVPEYRALVLVRATPADFINRIDVPEARLREEFDARRATLVAPETRSFYRIAASSQAQANDAVARLGRGETPEAVSQALNAPLTRGADQTRDQIADSAVAEAVFSMAANAPPRAVQSQLAPWTVVRVTSVTASSAPDFAQVRDQLRQELAGEEASELLQAAIASFEEARAAGTSAAEAARAAGLPITEIAAVNAQGQTPQGQQIEGLPADMVQVAFETSEGEASDFLPVGDADVVVAVTGVTPSSVRPLAEVRAQLVDAWTSRERARRLEELGADIVAAINGGQGFDAVVRARRLNVLVNSRDLDRRTAAQLPARELAALMFGAEQGRAVSSIRGDGGAVYVAVVENIQRTDPATAPEQVEAGRAQLQQAVGESLGEAVQSAIIADASTRRNQRLLDQLYTSGPTDDAAP